MSVDSGPALTVSDLRNTWYAEIFLIRNDGGEFKAAIYNTVGLNDGPLKTWRVLDAQQLAAQFQVPAVYLNGSRFWTLDSLTAYTVEETLSFDGLEARHLDQPVVTSRKQDSAVRSGHIEGVEDGAVPDVVEDHQAAVVSQQPGEVVAPLLHRGKRAVAIAEQPGELPLQLLHLCRRMVAPTSIHAMPCRNRLATVRSVATAAANADLPAPPIPTTPTRRPRCNTAARMQPNSVGRVTKRSGGEGTRPKNGRRPANPRSGRTHLPGFTPTPMTKLSPTSTSPRLTKAACPLHVFRTGTSTPAAFSSPPTIPAGTQITPGKNKVAFIRSARQTRRLGCIPTSWRTAWFYRLPHRPGGQSDHLFMLSLYLVDKLDYSWHIYKPRKPSLILAVEERRALGSRYRRG